MGTMKTEVRVRVQHGFQGLIWGQV
jgi:hypothetical protein